MTTDIAGHPRADYLIDRQSMLQISGRIWSRHQMFLPMAIIYCFKLVLTEALCHSELKCDCKHRAEKCTRKIKDCST